MIQVHNVGFAYHQREVLQDITLTAREGEILSLLGPNGSGKTTLLRCFNKILQPQRGRIQIQGRPLAALPLREVAKIIGYVPQQETATFPFTVFETVLMGRRPRIGWRLRSHDLDIVQESLQVMHLEHLSPRRLTELSGGERQRVAIARVLAQEPQVMLLDEPTSSLDLRHQLEVMETVANLVKKRGMTAVLAMHDLNLAARFSDQIVLLHHGHLFCAGQPGTVLTRDNIRTVYGVETEIYRRNGFFFVHPLRCAGALSGAPPAAPHGEGQTFEAKTRRNGQGAK
jgi:iron complex transport system ATP-binding protein